MEGIGLRVKAWSPAWACSPQCLGAQCSRTYDSRDGICCTGLVLITFVNSMKLLEEVCRRLGGLKMVQAVCRVMAA